MKTFFVMVYYDEGGVDEYEMEALSMDDAENIFFINYKITSFWSSFGKDKHILKALPISRGI